MIADAQRDINSLYQNCVDGIPEENRYRLHELITSNDHLHRLTDRFSWWDEKLELLGLSLSDTEEIKSGQCRNHPFLQRQVFENYLKPK